MGQRSARTRDAIKTIANEITVPTTTARQIRVRSGTLANRHPRRIEPEPDVREQPDGDHDGQDRREGGDIIDALHLPIPHREGQVARDGDREEVDDEEVSSAQPHHDVDGSDAQRANQVEVPKPVTGSGPERSGGVAHDRRSGSR